MSTRFNERSIWTFTRSLRIRPGEPFIRTCFQTTMQSPLPSFYIFSRYCTRDICNSLMYSYLRKLFVRDNAKVFFRIRGLKIFSGSKNFLYSIRCKNIELHTLSWQIWMFYSISRILIIRTTLIVVFAIPIVVICIFTISVHCYICK